MTDTQSKAFYCQAAMGRSVSGIALSANDDFSARYDLDRLKGIFSRASHRLAGESYVGRILVLNTAKGGVASSWMLLDMASRKMAPLALVMNSVNPILIQGAAFADLTVAANFDVDVTAQIKTGDYIQVDPAQRCVTIQSA